MTSAAAERRGFRVSGWLVPTLDALIEGAWIAVLEAAFAALGGTRPLGPLPFALAAGASLVLAWRAADRTTAYVGLAVLYVAAFVAGGLLGVAGGGPTPFAQAAAAFMALAVFRGSRHDDVLDDDLVTGSLLQWGFPLLAAPWLYATQLPPAARETFTAAAFPSTLVFAAAGLLALGLARLDSLAALSGVDWRSNRAWFVLLLSVLGAMLLIAIPSAFLVGAPLVLLAGGLLGPLAVLLTPVGFAFEKLIELIFLALTPILEFIQQWLRQRPPVQPPASGNPGPLVPPEVAQGEPSTIGLIVLGAIALVVAIGLFALLLRLTYRSRTRHEEAADRPFEEREFRPPTITFRRPRLRLAGRPPRPTTASGAYLAFLADLASAPHLARRPDEPPATHATRLREAGFGDRRAGRLAADYQLERYALRGLSPRETARAIRRWEGLRAAVRAASRPRPDGVPEQPA